MGITCKPMQEMKSMLKKIDNELLNEKKSQKANKKEENK